MLCCTMPGFQSTYDREILILVLVLAVAACGCILIFCILLYCTVLYCIISDICTGFYFVLVGEWMNGYEYHDYVSENSRLGIGYWE